MAEQLTLTAPITYPNLTTYSVREIRFNKDQNFQIFVRVLGSNNTEVTAVYEGATAQSLIVALNKANLSTISLEKRILNQLVSDGKLPAGTVTGAPD